MPKKIYVIGGANTNKPTVVGMVNTNKSKVVGNSQ